MKVGEVESDWFEIQSDEGQTIGGASVFERKRVVTRAVGSYPGFDPQPENIREMRKFAEAEARRLGMLDDAPRL